MDLSNTVSMYQKRPLQPQLLSFISKIILFNLSNAFLKSGKNQLVVNLSVIPIRVVFTTPTFASIELQFALIPNRFSEKKLT